MTDEQLRKIKKYFSNKPVKKAYLFGSQVRSETTGESDIDILVELDYTLPIGLEFVAMQLELEKILHYKVDLLSEQALSKYIRPHIDREKQLIYER